MFCIKGCTLIYAECISGAPPVPEAPKKPRALRGFPVYVCEKERGYVKKRGYMKEREGISA